MRLFFISYTDSAFFDSSILISLLSLMGKSDNKTGFTLKQTPKNLIMLRSNVRSLQEARKKNTARAIWETDNQPSRKNRIKYELKHAGSFIEL